MSTYAEMQSRAAALILKKGSVVQLGYPSRDVKAARILDEHHFIETGGLNSAFGMAKVSNGDFKYILEGGANPVEGEVLIDSRGQRLVIAWTEALAPADVVIAWIIWARNS